MLTVLQYMHVYNVHQCSDMPEGHVIIATLETTSFVTTVKPYYICYIQLNAIFNTRFAGVFLLSIADGCKIWWRCSF